MSSSLPFINSSNFSKVAVFPLYVLDHFLFSFSIVAICSKHLMLKMQVHLRTLFVHAPCSSQPYVLFTEWLFPARSAPSPYQGPQISGYLLCVDGGASPPMEDKGLMKTGLFYL